MTRYVMEIDLGECADAGEADRAGRTIANAIEYGWFARGHAVRPSLPVIRTCGRCSYCGPTSGGWSCDHPTTIARMHAQNPETRDCPQGPHVDNEAAPPSWCPWREEDAR